MIKCNNCKKEYSNKERRWITDEYGTFFDEICPYCKSDEVYDI